MASVVMPHTCLGEMLPVRSASWRGCGFMVVLLLGGGTFVPSSQEPGDLCSIAVLRRCLGQTDPGWGPTCTTRCVTLGKLLELSQTWFLSYKMGKIIGSINEIIFNVFMSIDYFLSCELFTSLRYHGKKYI